MKAVRVLVLVSLFVLAGKSALMAQTPVSVVLTGEQDGVASAASGRLDMIVSPNKIDYTLTAGGFGTNVTAAHLHLGFKGLNGPVFLFLFNPKTQGPFTGVVTGTILPSDLIQLKDRGISTFSDAVRAILSGFVYANVHTELNPGGEIRGQIPSIIVQQP